MQRLKVMTIVGTRPEIIKLSRVMDVLEQHTDHILVHTGQNYDYELNEIFFRDLEIKKPDYFLGISGKSPAEAIGQIIIEVDKVFEKENPEAVLIYGDTNSCLCVLAAKRRKIPIFHMEAGNRCFDQRVPEEINRKIIDHTSDINLTLSEHARRYLINEGLRPETIFKVGSSMKEVFEYYMQKIQSSNVLEELNLKNNNYFLVSLHREENIDSKENFLSLLETLNKMAEIYKKEIIVSTHPRTRLRLTEILKISPKIINEKIHFLKPFGFLDYIKLQMNAFCVISDSGSLTEDASLLDLPAVAIRETHERPEGMDVASIVMSGLETNRVIQSIDLVTSLKKGPKRHISLVSDYDVDNVSHKIIRIMMSYVDYVKRTVWHEKRKTELKSSFKKELLL